MTSSSSSSRPELILKEKSRGSSHDQEKGPLGQLEDRGLQGNKRDECGFRQNRETARGRAGAAQSRAKPIRHQNFKTVIS